MSASILLSKLSRVKKTGADRWMACCPAHQDKTASLSIKDLPDGRVLLHCFAGCDPDSVLAAVGLTFSDLMQERLQGDFKPVRFAFSALDALRALVADLLFIRLCALSLAQGRALIESDREALHQSAYRIENALAAIEVKP
ncbi:MAG: CHC2 zinc finger domain-containing protein [Chitinivorax sp.]